MSLINDALKRAKEAHHQAPVPPPDLPFRPVEPAQQRARRGLGLFVPVLLALVALLILFLAWQWTQRMPAAGTTEAAARTRSAALAIPEASRAPTTGNAAPTAPAATVEPPAPAGAAQAALATTSAPTNPPVAAVQDNAATNSAPAAAPEPPKPAPLRLQAILFHPTRPSAIISGKTVFVGDKVRELRVLAIGHESVTLAGSGQTNLLSLAH